MKAGCKISQKQPAVVKVKMLFSISQKEGKRSIVKLGEMICEIKVHLASNSIFSKSSSALDTAGCSCTHVSLGEAVPAHHFGGAGTQHLTVQHYMPAHPVHVSICLLGGRNIRCTGQNSAKAQDKAAICSRGWNKCCCCSATPGGQFLPCPCNDRWQSPSKPRLSPRLF